MSPAQPRFSLFKNAITIFGAALTTTGGEIMSLAVQASNKNILYAGGFTLDASGSQRMSPELPMMAIPQNTAQ